MILSKNAWLSSTIAFTSPFLVASISIVLSCVPLTVLDKKDAEVKIAKRNPHPIFLSAWIATAYVKGGINP